MSNTITITGTLTLIKNEKQLDKSFMTEFIVATKSGERTHHYILRSFSPGEFDKYGLHTAIGRDVSVECYLNGRKSESQKGTFYSNELHVKELRLV